VVDEETPKFPGWYAILLAIWLRINKAITAIVFAGEAAFLALNPDVSAPGKAAATAIGLAIIALMTESRLGVAQKVEVAKYVGALEEQTIAPIRAAVAREEAKAKAK
jgi:hypothetical protein